VFTLATVQFGRSRNGEVFLQAAGHGAHPRDIPKFYFFLRGLITNATSKIEKIPKRMVSQVGS